MNILILGSGGREHSLAWAIKQNPKCDNIYVASGNAGIAEIARCISIDILNPEEVLQTVKKYSIDFVIIGPEAPLAAGVSDYLRKERILTFGPSKASAQLETSKKFTKEICDASGAPTANYAVFDSLEAATAYIKTQGAPLVVKADGLAAGKGVIVATDIEMALSAVDEIFDGSFGDAGASVVIEEFMEGEEASLFVLVDGETVLPIGTAQDHKRVGEGDTGLNTGGMGAYSPAPILSEEVLNKTMEGIIRPTVREMVNRGMPFTGVLYAGLMIKDSNPRLVEYNVRFGDPECQVLMMRLGGQILDALLSTAKGELSNVKLNWADDHAITVVMASNGYPGSYTNGSQINGLADLPSNSNFMCFHAGTTEENGNIISNGGRVLNITARSETLVKAQKNAYEIIKIIDWPEGFYRKDIGWRAL
tara:strand:- start:90 stop:1352 length:1263 start_codon:yes stop_codon:yes gene_type:complete